MKGHCCLDRGESYRAAGINASPTAESHALPNKEGYKCHYSHLSEGVLDREIIKLTAGHCICDQKYRSHSRVVAYTL